MNDFYCPSCMQYYPDSSEYKVPHGSYVVCVDCDNDASFIDSDSDNIVIKKKRKKNRMSEKAIDYFIDRYGDQ